MCCIAGKSHNLLGKAFHFRHSEVQNRKKRNREPNKSTKCECRSETCVILFADSEIVHMSLMAVCCCCSCCCSTCPFFEDRLVQACRHCFLLAFVVFFLFGAPVAPNMLFVRVCVSPPGQRVSFHDLHRQLFHPQGDHPRT